MLQSFLREGHWNKVLGGPKSKENAPNRARLRSANAHPYQPQEGRKQARGFVFEDGVLNKPIGKSEQSNLGEEAR